MKKKINPNSVAVKNGQLFGLNCSPEDSRIVALPVPWDVTTSYRPGTVSGPRAILEASYQLDLYHPWLPEAWNLPLYLLPENHSWLQTSKDLRPKSAAIIDAMERGLPIKEDPQLFAWLAEINQKCQSLSQECYQIVKSRLQKQQRIICIGGDHSISLGPIRAYAEFFPQLSILHIDAHADLRKAYEGFEESHASIMHNVLKWCPNVTISQIGLRDVCQEEVETIQNNPNIHAFFDWDIKKDMATGVTWEQITDRILDTLGNCVYVSFDIDGLDPKLCPNTGTPVPGGLELWQVQFLLEKIVDSGRLVVGADLVEVAPDPSNQSEWDGNVGARALLALALSLAKCLS
ncbi:MAG: agmatinase family protein [Bdellovibrionaceae bacterium]|nr:agmatinase family protein [Pseudobdellovibrionaceae bacterium]MDW8189454.1 agmatinase family protein [Pseudobdellovibrionaceae bacterium]